MTTSAAGSDPVAWPALPFDAWADTCATLYLWTQVIGKIRLAHAPMINHWWQVPLYVTARGLTTSLMPYDSRSFQIDFDFCAHQLVFRSTDGAVDKMPLAPRTVADFYAEVMSRLRALGLETHIWTMPVEITDAIPFDQDTAHAAYDADYVHRFWQVLVQVDRVLSVFRSRFTGKVSPVHFFWGSFDMAVTRFSGRTAPKLSSTSPNLGAWVMQEAYSHEVSSCGFWPGNGGFGKAAFYAYAYPEPEGFGASKIAPPAAYYDQELGQFILPYDAARTAPAPDRAVVDFLQATYAAAADLGHWDRAQLERS
jgi:hypothetical protein